MKNWLKTQHSKNEDDGIQFHYFMANRWGKKGNSDRLYFLGLKNHCRWWLQYEIKRHLLLGRKAITNIDSMLKSKDITLSTKVHIVKAMVFPVVMYGCESWTVKKAEHWRIDAFELWCWRRLFRVPWPARRSNQSILKEISPAYSLEELKCWRWNCNTLVIWCKEPTHWERLVEKIEGRRKSGWQRTR